MSKPYCGIHKVPRGRVRGTSEYCIKVIPHNCIAHPFCAYFMASFSATSCTRTLKTWQICLDIELYPLKNGYSSPTGTGTPPFFQVIVINLSQALREKRLS